jgi:hypothetical protein
MEQRELAGRVLPVVMVALPLDMVAVEAALEPQARLVKAQHLLQVRAVLALT